MCSPDHLVYGAAAALYTRAQGFRGDAVLTDWLIDCGGGGGAPHSDSLSSDALTFLMYLFASVRMIEETYFSNMACSCFFTVAQASL